MTIPAIAPPASRAARCTLPLLCAAAELASESATAATSLSLSAGTDMMISKLTMWGEKRRYTKMLRACLPRPLHTYERAHIRGPYARDSKAGAVARQVRKQARHSQRQAPEGCARLTSWVTEA